MSAHASEARADVKAAISLACNQNFPYLREITAAGLEATVGIWAKNMVLQRHFKSNWIPASSRHHQAVRRHVMFIWLQ